MKNIKRLISMAMAIAVIMSLSIVPVHAVSSAQQALSSAANILRSDLGRSNDDATVKVLSEQWHYEAGNWRPDSRGFYFSGYDRTFHYYDGKVVKEGNSNTNGTRYGTTSDYTVSGYTRYNGYDYYNGWYDTDRSSDRIASVSYNYDGYRWYRYASDSSQYFRIESKKAVWATQKEIDKFTDRGSRSTSYTVNAGEVYYTYNLALAERYNYAVQDGYYYDVSTSSNSDRFYRYRNQNGNDNRQRAALNALRTVSSYYDVNTPVMTALLDVVSSEYGENMNASYLLSAHDGRYYYFGASAENGNYRTDTTYNYNGSSYADSNFWQNQNYYNGMFVGVEKYIDTNKQTIVARYLASYYSEEADIDHVTAGAWSFVDLAGSKDYATVAKESYPDYNANSSLAGGKHNRDWKQIAGDILFRKEAERHGVVDVGRTLAKGYTHLWIEDSTVYFRNGNYGSDHSHDWNFSLRSPYKR
ncbi:hypothetical protein IJ117_02020 [Candidatus Saccharibacteria bacterium]|nr:hypothetical protein [Candidatus Saccharibacteria bacterium]